MSIACIISLYCIDNGPLAGSDPGFIKPDAQNWLLLNFWVSHFSRESSLHSDYTINIYLIIEMIILFSYNAVTSKPKTFCIFSWLCGIDVVP